MHAVHADQLFYEPLSNLDCFSAAKNNKWGRPMFFIPNLNAEMKLNLVIYLGKYTLNMFVGI
jgi:hypothetical protein